MEPAETTEDLNEWRSALENALAQAPSVANTMGQNPIFSTDVAAEPAEAPAEQSEDSSVIGRPAEFALVEADGSPSFLEKALKFIEDHGVKVEGILRQSADVEEVKRRVRDYEKGKNEFSSEEDAHVIGDCIKYVLREMPSSPVPASCCSALVKAYHAYTESDDDDVDKEYSTDNDIHDDDGSYESGEDDVEEDLEDSDGSEHDKVKNNSSESAVAQAAEINIRSHPKQESSGSNESKGHMVKSNSRSSSSKEKSMEKSSSSGHKGKKTLWGRTSARKDLSTEEIEYSGDDETLIDKLENNKTDLQSKIAKEAKENAILQASLVRRKEELRERRLALEKEVENLRDQLQKERNLRTSLESGLMNMRRGQVSLPSTIDSKTKADLEEVVTAESDIMNLKQKASDLRGQVSGQQLCCESCNKQLLNTDRTGGPESSSVEASPTVGGDSASDMGDVEQSRKQKGSTSSTDKPGEEAVGSITSQRAPQRMQSIAREGQEGTASASKWSLAQRQYSNSPLIRGLQESGGSAVPAASFALAKLTNRLNFLKERRAQLASEMQSLDLGRPPTAAAAAAAGAPSVKSPSPKGPEKRS
ncbi:unnamed protein product [Urochloa decumbens]|uniref:PH domain-containing protein n=1 Tax=Urochloa decumbens TaxID=240449 RepID=A0ABC9DC27_9POAL